MSRYIDADALLEKMKRTDRYFAVKFDIEEMPTADVVEVVRCKDCKHYKTPECAMWYECSECGGQWGWCNPNDYCSYGERKER